MEPRFRGEGEVIGVVDLHHSPTALWCDVNLIRLRVDLLDGACNWRSGEVPSCELLLHRGLAVSRVRLDEGRLSLCEWHSLRHHLGAHQVSVSLLAIEHGHQRG